MGDFIPVGGILGFLVRVVFWGAIVYAVMRTFWAIWEIPDRLHDIERRLAVLSDDLRRIEAGGTVEKERKE